MAKELFYGLSRAELKKEIDEFAAKDNRSLPSKAKVFAAVAKMQKFDMLPDVATPSELTALIADGGIELHRGLSSNSGITATLYASELVRGPMFPGTLTAFGQGIYLSTTSENHSQKHPSFPRISHVARKYAEKCPPGMIVRCVLKKDAKTEDSDELLQFLKENKNRAKDVFGSADLGIFAASLGFDGYFCAGVEHPDETTWVILNRASLVFQTTGLQINKNRLTLRHERTSRPD